MQKDREKEHNKVIKYIHKINKKIANDKYIGLNRFRVDMYREYWKRFEDNSGGYLTIVFKMTDKLTNNSACFISSNFGFVYDLNRYLNDFLVRCSSGHPGHYPPLHYVTYDISEVISYSGNKVEVIKDYVVDKYSWIK